MSNSFYVMVYGAPFVLPEMDFKKICPQPPCAVVSFSTVGFQRAEVIKQSDYDAAKNSADTFATKSGIKTFTLIRIELDVVE